MVRRGSDKAIQNLLRLSGLIFAVVGAIHVSRYFLKFPVVVGRFEITYLGSLIVGILLGWLATACFLNSRRY